MGKNPFKIMFLDVGGVLLTNGWGHDSRQKAAAEFGIDFMEMEAKHNFIFNVYEIGRITLDEYLDIVVFDKTRVFTREDFKAFMFSRSVELTGMLSWLIELKKNNSNLKIVSINNEGKELNDYRVKKFQLHNCFDAFISSCEVGMRKPDPGIFRLALGVVQAAPNECIYFDDRIYLVDAAQRLGIRGYHHLGFESSKKIIEDLM
ncbi:HAD family hydrolase [Segetibacter aerophilus]|uniref:Hydrolase n=1 Tax=Segetibacter aerophilus TaxID=670293 RepID=A0A512BJI5_9BACT|nr:HAD-IA family hydrolase [Segetibacter aerophilus]GEO12133.1 hydrolase [Segetibacter aerophilus]